MEGSWVRCAHVPTLAARQLGMRGLLWVFGELLFLTRPHQRRSRVSLKAEGDLVELGREERGLGGTPATPSLLARGLGVGPQRGWCSRAAERFILSPGLRQGGAASPDLQVSAVRSAFGWPSGRPQVLWGHSLVGRRLAVEAELLHQRVDLLASHVAEWDSLKQKRGGVSAPGPASRPSSPLSTSPGLTSSSSKRWPSSTSSGSAPGRCFITRLWLEMVLRWVVVGGGRWGLPGTCRCEHYLVCPSRAGIPIYT